MAITCVLASYKRYWTGCLALLVALLPAISLAYGLPLHARIPAERALIVYADGVQEIIIQVELDDVKDRSAVVLPVPEIPEVDQPPAGETLFAYLEEATQPEEQVVRRIFWRPESRDAVETAAARPVQSPDRRVLGGYDIVMLNTKNAENLDDWLNANDYTVPPVAQHILADYVAEGWAFVAVKLANQAASTATLAPIRLRFESDAIIYPMRLGTVSDQPLDLQVYVVTDHRVTMEPLETLYADFIAQLDPAPPANLATLLTRAPYLTRLRLAAVDAQPLTTDLTARAAPSNEPYRATTIVYEDVSILQEYGILTALLCLVVLNAITIVVAISFKRRFDAISPDADSK